MTGGSVAPRHLAPLRRGAGRGSRNATEGTVHAHPPAQGPHSWSDFRREVGIIVVGILLALGAEQVIEALHRRERVAVADEGIKVRGDLAEVDRANAEMVVVAHDLLASQRAAHQHYGKAAIECDRREMLRGQRARRGSCVADLPLDLG